VAGLISLLQPPLRQRGSPWMVGLPADAGLECKLPTGRAEQDGHLGGWLPEKVPAFLIAGNAEVARRPAGGGVEGFVVTSTARSPRSPLLGRTGATRRLR
jgi:hypothetical protein